MKVILDLEYTPRSPRPGMPYTESSFVRAVSPYTFRTDEIGIALVDLWNFGWEDGPVVECLGAELSTERGISHALRKREIIVQRIAPAVSRLRECGVQIFHCNHPLFLGRYPQWRSSTTIEERSSIAHGPILDASGREDRSDVYPELEWQAAWKSRHRDDLYNDAWMEVQGQVYEQIRIPAEVEPLEGDLLVYSGEQFDRLLRDRRVRVIFYMGFETDECIMNSTYGIKSMHARGCMTNIVRDCTTTYESALTVGGLWRTAVAIEQIEKMWGYSISSSRLLEAFMWK